jgi:hypothetical protein
MPLPRGLTRGSGRTGAPAARRGPDPDAGAPLGRDRSAVVRIPVGPAACGRLGRRAKGVVPGSLLLARISRAQSTQL